MYAYCLLQAIIIYVLIALLLIPKWTLAIPVQLFTFSLKKLYHATLHIFEPKLYFNQKYFICLIWLSLFTAAIPIDNIPGPFTLSLSLSKSPFSFPMDFFVLASLLISNVKVPNQDL